MRLPTVVCVRVEGVKDAGEIDTEVFCVNETPVPYQLSVRSTSFTTVDEETGAAVEHGSGVPSATVRPGEAVLIGAVAGWEWDGHVGMEITFMDAQTGSEAVRAYSLKEGDRRVILPGSARQGRVVPARRLG